MHVACPCCLELLNPNDDLVATPCGHVFHGRCIKKWIEAGRPSCPQCRNRFSESQLRRIFLSESADQSNVNDPGLLQSKIDALTFEVRCAEKEQKTLKEEVHDLKGKNKGLQEQVQVFDTKRKRIQEKLDESRAEVKYLQAQKADVRRAKEEAADLREKLHIYDSVNSAINDSVGEVNRRLHELGDFSKASKELSIIAEALKRELHRQNVEKTQLRRNLQVTNDQLQRLRKKAREQETRLTETCRARTTLEADYRHADEERAGLREKVRQMEKALNSPADLGRVHARRILAESPAPLTESPTPIKEKIDFLKENSSERDDVDLFSESEEEKDSVGKNSGSKSKNGQSEQVHIQCISDNFADLFGTRKRSPLKDAMAETLSQMNIMKKSRLAGSQAASANVPSDVYYNGLGGHAKSDEFPKPLGVSVSKKQLKKKRLMTQSHKEKKTTTIDKFFKFDTP